MKAAKRLHEAMLSSVLYAPISFFHTNPLGRLINRFTKDTGEVDLTLIFYTSLFLQCLFQLFSTFGIIAFLNPIAIIAILPLLLVFSRIFVYFQNSAREIKRLDAITRSPVYSQFSEALNGSSTIRAYRAEGRMEAANGLAVDRNIRYTLATMSANRWLAIRLEFLGGLIIWGNSKPLNEKHPLM